MKTTFTKTADWSIIPEEFQGPLTRYIDEGLHPGSFMLAALGGDLFSAVNMTGESRWPAIGPLAVWALRYAPIDSYGSERKVMTWLATGGAIGNGLK